MERQAKIKSAMFFDFKDKDGKQHTGYKVGYEFATDRTMLFGSPLDSFTCSVDAFNRYDLHEGDDVILCGGYTNGKFAVYGVFE